MDGRVGQLKESMVQVVFEMTNDLKSTYDYAIDYAAKRFSVICLQPKSKKPAIGSWDSLKRSYPSTEQLESWFVNTENNIGIITGRISSSFAIDIDGNEIYNFFIQKIESLSSVDKQLVQSIKDT